MRCPADDGDQRVSRRGAALTGEWGYLRVFEVPGLDHAARQLVVRVGERVFRLAWRTRRSGSLWN